MAAEASRRRQINLLVGCREEAVARALAQRIAGAGDGIAAVAVGLTDVVTRAAASQPDVLIYEYLRELGTLAWGRLHRVRLESAGTRVLVLCPASVELPVVDCIQRGTSGCLSTASAPAVLAKAVAAVHAGQPWFGRMDLFQALRTLLMAVPSLADGMPDGDDLLTPREQQILGLIGSAMSNKEIARMLKISDKTVKTHLHHIYVKLHRSGRYKAFFARLPPVRRRAPQQPEDEEPQ